MSARRQNQLGSFFLAACLLLVSAGPPAGAATWKSIGPHWGSVEAIAVSPQSPSVIFAGSIGGRTFSGVNTASSGGIFKSVDGGSTWEQISSLGARSIAADPKNVSVVYAGSPSDIFKSTDGGASWTGLNSGLQSAVLTIDPLVPSTLYASTTAGFYKSTNGGSTWALKASGSGRYVVDPVTPSTLYRAADSGIAKSADGGETWTILNNGLPSGSAYPLAVDPKSPAIIYAGNYVPAIFKSLDGGASWSQVFQVSGNHPSTQACVIDPLNPAILYLAIREVDYSFHSWGTVLKSADGGASWTRIQQNTWPIQAMALNPARPCILFVGYGESGSGLAPGRRRQLDHVRFHEHPRVYRP